jgi:hypothetical protein
MIFYTLDHVVEKTLKQNLTAEQMFLKKFTGDTLSGEEARRLFEKIRDHKWYVSERLGRDVGLKVAAIDYLENIRAGGDSRRKLRRDLNLKVYENLSLTA